MMMKFLFQYSFQKKKTKSKLGSLVEKYALCQKLSGL